MEVEFQFQKCSISTIQFVLTLEAGGCHLSSVFEIARGKKFRRTDWSAASDTDFYTVAQYTRQLPTNNLTLSVKMSFPQLISTIPPVTIFSAATLERGVK